MGRVFVSYSHENSDIVKYVNNFLTSNNILTWFDQEDIKESDYWDTHIRTALYCSDVFLMFLSKAYISSTYCRKELGIAKSMAKCKIIVVGIDDTCNSFSIDGSTESIQRIAFNYKTQSVDDLCSILINNEYIKKCNIYVDFMNIKSSKPTAFLSGIANFYNAHPKHHEMLFLYLNFAQYILNQETNGYYISPEANFSSLNFFQVDSNSSLRHILKVDEQFGFCQTFNPEVRNNYLKRILFVLFNYGYVDFAEALQPHMKFNMIFSDELSNESEFKKSLFEIINKHIDDAYQDLSNIDSHLKKIYKILNATFYLENYFSVGNSEKVYPYEVNDLVIDISRHIVIKNKQIKDITVDGVCAKILCEESGDSYLIENLLDNVKENIFLYGDIGCGKTTQFIKAFLQNRSSLYIDLMLAFRRFDDDLIKNCISKLDKYYLLNFNNLFNYSSYSNKITLFIDNLDRLPDNSRKKIINEIAYLSVAFRIVVFSSKRNIEGKISIDERDSTLKTFKYCEILPLDKQNIICYFRANDINENIIHRLETLENRHTFFTFFNNFTKLRVLLESIKNSVDFDCSKIELSESNEIEIYRTIFEGKADYSVSKRISQEFANTIVPIDDVIVKLVLDEIEKLKEISYSKKYEQIKNLRFRDLNCLYCILGKENGNYKFLNEDIESYFVASYVIRKLSEFSLDFNEIEDLLLPLKEDYIVLKYLNQMNILEYIKLECLFELPKNQLIELKLIMFKICQYCRASRQKYKKLSDIEEIPDNFFFNAENIKIVAIPNSVKQIGRASFSNMTRLEKLILTSNTSELAIKPWSILNCQNLKSIIFGANYLQYNSPLFSKCILLQEIIIPDINPAFTTIHGNHILASKDKKTLYTSVNDLGGVVHIPEGVEFLMENALSNLDEITELNLPSSIVEIDTSFCDFCGNLKRIHICSKKYFSDDNGIVFTYENNKKVLFRVPPGYENDLTVPDDVSVIGSDSISCCSKIKTITIPSTITKVENYAFADTTGLEKLIFKNISAIDYFGNYILLTTNIFALIEVYYDDYDDEADIYSVDSFVSSFIKMDNNNYIIPLNNRKVKINDFEKQGFEIISNRESNDIFRNGVILRAINLFENKECSPKDFNILIIGMTEYKTINSKPVYQMKEYIEELIESKHISMVVYTRDLPMIRQLYEYTDRISIIRTNKGSTFANKKLKEILMHKGNNND